MKFTANHKPYQQSEDFSDWCDSVLGQKLTYVEQQELDRILPDLFGYHLLQIGSIGPSLSSASKIMNKVVMCCTEQPVRNCSIIGSASQLPVQPDCLDAVIICHSLDFADDPKQLLREVERVLVPEGHIVILGFNPRSLWGLRRFIGFGNRPAPWNGRFLAAPRVKDWLALLGFEVESTHYRFYRPPIQHSGMLARLNFLESWGARWWPFGGAAYILLATKKVSTLTPIKPRWRPKRSVVAGLGDAASRSYLEK